MNDTYL
jgi:hypothetical protein